MESTVKVDASSLPGAVGKAVREFVKGLDRKAEIRYEQEWAGNYGQVRRHRNGGASQTRPPKAAAQLRTQPVFASGCRGVQSFGGNATRQNV